MYVGEERCIECPVGKPEGRKQLGRSRRKRDNNKNNDKMDLQEVKWEALNWIYLAKNRDRWRALVNAVINRQGP